MLSNGFAQVFNNSTFDCSLKSDIWESKRFSSVHTMAFSNSLSGCTISLRCENVCVSANDSNASKA